MCRSLHTVPLNTCPCCSRIISITTIKEEPNKVLHCLSLRLFCSLQARQASGLCMHSAQCSTALRHNPPPPCCLSMLCWRLAG